MRQENQTEQLSLGTEFGRTSQAPSAPVNPGTRTSGSSSKNSCELRTADYLFLDLRPGGGNLLGPYWEKNSPSLGEFWTLNTGPAPHNEEGGSTLSRILTDTPHPKYYLSKAACLGILRRSRERGKALPPVLEAALRIQAKVDARACVSEGVAPTLTSADGGDRRLEDFVICLCDQGGDRMDVSAGITGTLRARMDSHPPLVLASQQGGAEIGSDVCPTITSAAGTSGNNQPVLFENHSVDARYTGPHEIAPTIQAAYGTGGNNQSLIAQPEAFCIAGNAIDRQPQNGGNGHGWQTGVSYSLTCTDRHAVYAQRGSCDYTEDAVASTQCARQYKDATDLVIGSFIRRLTPLQCERLQGYPDHYTDISDASDSARYKALGNSVALPCVDYVLRGVLYFLEKEDDAHA